MYKLFNFRISWWNIYINIGRFTVWVHFPWSWFDYGFEGFMHKMWSCIPNDNDGFWGVFFGIEYFWKY